MRRVAVVLLSLAFLGANVAAMWATNVGAACPVKCPFCP